jgi:hypothetical protein
MTRFVPFLFAAALAACTPQVVPHDNSRPQSAAISLVGHWRIAAIDGRDLNEPQGLALVGDARQLWMEPRCAGLIRNYRISGTTFSSTLEKVGMVCMIGMPQSSGLAMQAIDAATRIERTPENGILLSGGGRSLLLFSQ